MKQTNHGPLEAQRLHLEFHIDDDYRLINGAPDAWLGLICDEGADEVLDLTELAAVDIRAARAAAEAFCRAWNRKVNR